MLHISLSLSEFIPFKIITLTVILRNDVNLCFKVQLSNYFFVSSIYLRFLTQMVDSFLYINCLVIVPLKSRLAITRFEMEEIIKGSKIEKKD